MECTFACQEKRIFDSQIEFNKNIKKVLKFVKILIEYEKKSLKKA